MTTFEKILKELKSGIFRPIYLLMGDETYFIDKITNYIEENALPESQRTFNQIIVYGRDTDIYTIMELARRYPMMAERFVIIVKEAQVLRKFDKIKLYAQKPTKSTVLVLNYKYKTAAKSVVNEIEKNGGVVYEAKKLYEYQVPKWIENYLKENGYSIDIQAVRLLVEFLGTDLSKIANELDKLMILIDKKTLITPEIIEKNIGISKDYNVFELQKALANKDVEKANKIIFYFAQNPKNHPFILTISSLYYFFTKVMIVKAEKNKNEKHLASLIKVHPFFVRDYLLAAKKYSTKKLISIISFLREYDLKAKGVDNYGTSDGELLKELIFKILH